MRGARAGIAEEESLAENVMRVCLHPLDQFRAFNALIEDAIAANDRRVRVNGLTFPMPTIPCANRSAMALKWRPASLTLPPASPQGDAGRARAA